MGSEEIDFQIIIWTYIATGAPHPMSDITTYKKILISSNELKFNHCFNLYIFITQFY